MEFLLKIQKNIILGSLGLLQDLLQVWSCTWRMEIPLQYFTSSMDIPQFGFVAYTES